MENTNKLPKDLGYWHMLHILEWIMQNPFLKEKDYYNETNMIDWDYSQQGYEFWDINTYNKKEFRYTDYK